MFKSMFEIVLLFGKFPVSAWIEYLVVYSLISITGLLIYVIDTRLTRR